MAKDRKSTAKRQQETDKPRKVTEKLNKRDNRTGKRVIADPSISELSDGVIRVLKIFRRYLMTPGQMLCLSGPEFETNKKALQELITTGFLVAEEFKGGYSLTAAGFHAMKTRTGAAT